MKGYTIMDIYTNSLHVYYSDAEEVKYRLAQCAVYSDVINTPHIEKLEDKIKKTESRLLQFYHLLKTLKKRKDILVKFYIINDTDHISIYSDFFQFDGAFEMAKYFFSDLDANVFAVSFDDGFSIKSDVIRGESLLKSVYINYKDVNGDTFMAQLTTQLKEDSGTETMRLSDRMFSIIKEVSKLRELGNEKAIRFLKANAEIDEYVL